MTQLFAALGLDRTMRFIGEVARGAACACVCPECGSPLIARQGREKDWHFAHEAGQERPECLAGAMNMLRRLVMEYLQGLPVLTLPRYTREIRMASTFGTHTETVSWNAQFVGRPTWLEGSTQTAAIARGRLDNGLDADVYLDFSDTPPRYVPGQSSAGAAAVVFWCSVPVGSDLRKRLYAEQHIRNRGQFIWRHQPDVFGLVSAATRRLHERAQADADRWEAERQRQAEQEAQRRAEIARARQMHAIEHAPRPTTCAAGGASAPAAPSPTVLEYPWAPGWKPLSAFMFYRLRDGSAWVVYSLQDGSAAIAPWPAPTPGWDEALPSSVGTADATAAIYRASSTSPAIMYLAPLAQAVRVTSNPAEFEGV